MAGLLDRPSGRRGARPELVPGLEPGAVIPLAHAGHRREHLADLRRTLGAVADHGADLEIEIRIIRELRGAAAAY